ncbi:MAG: thymidine phosphorylase [Acidimicrobiaceae bacterium]|nr:thymidine phosphorylase [Acidimicrobiaceae bacterium]
MDAVDVIRTKRAGLRLSDDQIRWFINGYTAGDVADEQASALLMAIVWRGMEPDELATWTAAMIESGERLVLAGLDRPTVDKHSTGGVGDKVSLVLCPLVAACGAAVPQLSGRGLGHTGGTLDKMESIAGWTASLSNAAIITQLREVGAVIAAAGADLTPADGKLYALRDVTGTVESIPLIASSIMSKKIAEGTESLVLDVKVGTGAFMRSLEDARQLAETMVQLGTAHGVRTTALLTAMDTPLGRTAGNALEVVEAVEILHGGGPADLIEITLALADEMVALAGLTADPRRHLSDGSAHEVWCAMVRAQGGDPDAALPESSNREIVRAPASGYVHGLDALAVGVAAWRLGAGRSRKEDPVSPIAGVVCLAKPGVEVVEGEPVFELHIDDRERLASALAALDGAVTIGSEPPPPRALVIDTIRA